MILNLKSKIFKHENDLFLNNIFFSIKIDYVIGNFEFDVENNYFIFVNPKLDNKNKIIFEVLVSSSYELLNYFLFINSVDLIGIKTTQKIFKIGIEEFKVSLEQNNTFILKNKYKLSDKQIQNLYKKTKSNSNNLINNNLTEIEKQLILLGYKKNLVNKIMTNNYQQFNSLSNDEIIQFMIKELSYEFKKI